MGYKFMTKNDYNMYDMSSMLQKAVRRGDLDRAGFAANELFYSYERYTWKRLITISAEDCYGIMTKEIIALKIASDIVNEKRKKEDKDLVCCKSNNTLMHGEKK